MAGIRGFTGWLGIVLSSPNPQVLARFYRDLFGWEIDTAVEDALSLGATAAAHQPQDDVRVMLDPDGHPFCLYLDE